MAIFVNTTQPRKLLEDIKKEINDKKIDTWLYDMHVEAFLYLLTR